MDAFLKCKTTTVLVLVNGLVYCMNSAGNQTYPNRQFGSKDTKLMNLVQTAFYHMNYSHFIYNMMSLIYKGHQFEKQMGSAKFGFTALILICLSNFLIAVASLSEYLYPLGSAQVGFSALIFSLKVLLNKEFHSLNNATWMEWFVVPILFPERKVIVGLFCAILAGCMYIHAEDILRTFTEPANPNPQHRDGEENLTWVCPHCSATNGVYLEVCGGCHGPRMGC
eukprot:Gb_08600 [translate_table: standard]